MTRRSAASGSSTSTSSSTSGPPNLFTWIARIGSVHPVTAVDDELVTGVVRARCAGEVHRRAHEVRGLPPAPLPDAAEDARLPRLEREGAPHRTCPDPTRKDRVGTNA